MGKFSGEEDATLIFDAMTQYGTDWFAVATLIPG
jgi:hypothetical protein